MPSESVAIVGESGSGKSVTALSILKLLNKQTIVQGKMLFRSKANTETDLLNADPRLLRSLRGNRISMIFQEPMTSLNPVMSCGKQILESINTHQSISAAEAEQRVKEALQWAGLPDPEYIRNRFPHQLSGGQKQRVMIAMAMACRPELLMADEPTTALDIRTQKEIIDSLKRLRNDFQMSLLFISHDLDLVAGLADRIIVMRHGEIVESGAASEILENPAHAYTRELMEAGASLKRGKSISIRKESKTIAPLLEVKSLCVNHRFGHQNIRAVDDVSFDIFPGEIVGLVGESGCGKTTLGRTLLQLQPVYSGEILLKGENISKKGLQSEMQIVFQDPYGSLNPLITAGRAIQEVLKVHHVSHPEKEIREKVNGLLEQVELDKSSASRFPHEFSGGQRQRICIARALAADPSFMVFDESVSALDVRIQTQILRLILQLRDTDGITALFISHDLSAVRSICDRILIMKNGRLIESGRPEDIFESPREAYTRQLLDAIPRNPNLKTRF